MEQLKAPFPWFGGKSKVGPIIWDRFLPPGSGDPKKGDAAQVTNYIEPFAGSLAILLQRPSATVKEGIIETVNDFDCYVANFWRALKCDPEQTAYWADYPVIEIDLIARNNWLVDQRPTFREKMVDPSFYDPKIAGWWVWGLSQWIGGGFCDKKVGKKLPHLGGGEGIHSRSGRTIKSKWVVPTIGGGLLNEESELSVPGERIKVRFEALSDRLRTVRVACGDWTGIMSEAVTTGNGITGIVLDPPYTAAIQSVKYAGDTHQAEGEDIADKVRRWAIQTAELPVVDPAHPRAKLPHHAGRGGKIRIALCGYESEAYKMPDDWECVKWKATGGFGSQGKVEKRDIEAEFDPKNAFGKTVAERERDSIISQSRGRENAHLERIWFSPSCDGMGQKNFLDQFEPEEEVQV